MAGCAESWSHNGHQGLYLWFVRRLQAKGIGSKCSKHDGTDLEGRCVVLEGSLRRYLAFGGSQRSAISGSFH
eukprot:1565019-Lingulodinium_polyedra.AAC.1